MAVARYRIKGTKVYVNEVAARHLPANAQEGILAPRPRRAVALQNSYDAASMSPRLARWRWSNMGPNLALMQALPALQGRSNDAVRRFGLADAAIDILTAHLVGDGIRPIFNSGDPGVDRELTLAFNEWNLEADADEQLDGLSMQGLAMRSCLVEGDSFLRFRPRLMSDGYTVPLQVQIIPSAFCPTDFTRIADNGRDIVAGIERDALGQRSAYWMYRRHPNDDPFGRGEVEPTPIPASEIMHLSTGPLKQVGLLRGEPWLARALIKMLDLDEWDDAHLKRQALAQLFGGWITPSAEGTFDYSNVVGSGGGVGASDDNPWIDNGDTATAYMEAGGINVLRPGEEITFSNPPSPGDQYEPFTRQQLRFAAGSVGLLYEQLSGDYTGVNDRTWRAGIGEFKKRLSRWQKAGPIFKVCHPMTRRFILAADLSGRVRLPRTMDAEQVAARTRWGVPVMPYINPVQDVQARVAEIRGGLNSRENDAAEHGEDANMIDEANKRDQDREATMGLVYETNAAFVSKAGVTNARPAGSIVPDPTDPELAQLAQAAIAARSSHAEAEARYFAALQRKQSEQTGA